ACASVPPRPCRKPIACSAESSRAAFRRRGYSSINPFSEMFRQVRLMHKLLLSLAAALVLAAAPVAAKERTTQAATAATSGGADQKTGIDTVARHALIVDFKTGVVLMEMRADERMPPASMSKIMTAYVVFSFLKEGRATLDDMLPVSEKAWRTGGSKMFVMVGTRVRLEDLLRGMIIQSGNDACIVLAEGLAGSEEAFVEIMNRKAREI